MKATIRGLRIVLISQAEMKALREVAVAVDQSLPLPAPSAALGRAIKALDNGVRWDRAGRVLFGLTPACAGAITGALERTRPFWDGERRAARHVRWFLRKLAQ